MIDVTRESLVPVRDVPRCLPPRCKGNRVHISAVYRWMQKGVRGVVLDSCRIGGTTYTSREALQRFADQLTGDAPPPNPPTQRTSVGRSHYLARVAEAVARELGLRNAH